MSIFFDSFFYQKKELIVNAVLEHEVYLCGAPLVLLLVLPFSKARRYNL